MSDVDVFAPFFPPCLRPDCEQAGADHKHVLPAQAELLNSGERFVCYIGGYGSGKSLAAAVAAVALSLQVDGNIGVVARKSYPKLHDSTERVLLEVLQRAGIDYQEREKRDGWPHRIILPNDSEILFRETKDPARWLGQEIGWFWVDEASEEEKKLFIDLVGRLRWAVARKYLKGILTTNPPHHQSWIPEIFGLKPGVTVKTEQVGSKAVSTSYRLIRGSTHENPFVPPDYIANLQANNPASEVKRIIEGEYGFTWEGKAVYAPPFSFDKHVWDIKPIDGYAIVRSWDFGYHAPAVTWQQFPRCASGKIHWLILREYLGKDIETEEFARVILAETKLLVPDLPKHFVLDCGDAAGDQVSERGPGPIRRLGRPPFNLKFDKKHLPNVDPGLALVREALAADVCKCGKPIFQVNRTCKDVIEGLAGGYHYPAFKLGKVTEQVLKPVKDGFYDNPMDTIRYAGEIWYRRLTLDPGLLQKLMADTGPSFQQPTSDWSWMERLTA